MAKIKKKASIQKTKKKTLTIWQYKPNKTFVLKAYIQKREKYAFVSNIFFKTLNNENMENLKPVLIRQSS